MRFHFFSVVVLVSLAMIVPTFPLAFAYSAKEAKAKVEETEKALGEAREAARQEKKADDDWLKKQSEAFQNGLDTEKKEEEARAAREKANETGKEEDVKAADKAEKIADAAREKAEKSDQVLATATEALNQAKAAKERAKEKAAGTIAPAEKAVDDLPESSVKDKLKERIQKVKGGLDQLALAPKASGTVETTTGTSDENIFAKADSMKGQNILGSDQLLKPSALSSREMQMKTDTRMKTGTVVNTEMPIQIHSGQPVENTHPMKDDSSTRGKY